MSEVQLIAANQYIKTPLEKFLRFSISYKGVNQLEEIHLSRMFLRA